MRFALAWVTILCLACSESPPPSCPNAYERITGKEGGHELALAYKEHVPTADEKIEGAALWSLLIVSAHNRTVNNELFARVGGANLLANLPAAYPSAFRGCGGATSPLTIASSQTSSAISFPGTSGPIASSSQAIISDPFQCTDDCLISLDDINKLLVEPLVRGLQSLGALSPIYGEALMLTQALEAALLDPSRAGQSIQQAAKTAISQENAGALLAAIGEGLGHAGLVAAAVAELAGAAEIGPIIAGTAALIGLATYTARIKLLADRIQACRDFKDKHCYCMGPKCGCADLGESSFGVMCCAQGGLTQDGGWYVIAGSSTCCVLNTSEYTKHSQMCYMPPDKTPGPCPSCRADADCCDRAQVVGQSGEQLGLADTCNGGRCCGKDGPERPGAQTVIDHSCCSGVRYVENNASRRCAPAP